MVCFRDLPIELIYGIVGYLYQEDAQRLRLTCRRLSFASLPALFGKIAFSRMKRDKEVFEAIAACPHIAKHVRELVYYELDLDIWAMLEDHRDYLEEHPEQFSLPSPAGSFLNEMRDFSWIPVDSWPENGGFPGPTLEDHRLRFFELLRNFPGLDTFASVPMREGRVISYQGRKMTIDMHVLRLAGQATRGNRGFTDFLQPAMALPESRVVNLRFVEARYQTSMAFPSPSPLDARAFRALTSIDMSVIPPRDDDNPHLALAECLRAATGLRRLKLQLIKHQSGPQYEAIPILQTLFHDSYWSQLESLHMVDTTKAAAGVTELVRKHAESLRSLRFNNCWVCAADLNRMRRIGLPALESIKLTYKFPERCRVNEAQLVAYLKGATRRCATEWGGLAGLDGQPEASNMVTVDYHPPGAIVYYGDMGSNSNSEIEQPENLRA